MDNEEHPLSNVPAWMPYLSRKEIECHIVDGKHEMKEHIEPLPESKTHGNILFLDEQST